MSLTAWWHRHLTRLGRDIAWRERCARRRGLPHVPLRPVGPISIGERAARFQRGMEVIHSLSPDCLRMLQEDGRILSEAAACMKPQPPRPRHHGMFIVAGETIPTGQVIHLSAHADGSFIARARRLGHE